MKIDRLKDNNPIKMTPAPKIEVSGSFQCQQCMFEADVAEMINGQIVWVCVECNFKSVVNGLG